MLFTICINKDIRGFTMNGSSEHLALQLTAEEAKAETLMSPVELPK